MPAVTKRSSKKVTVKHPTTALYERMFEKPGKNLIAIVAILTAGAVAWSWVGTLALNGPMPYPSRAEVDKLRKETIDLGATTLELAKLARAEAQQALHKGDQNRLDGLLARKVQLDALIAMNPADTGLKLILEQTLRSITELSQTAAAAQVTYTPAPTAK